MLKRMPAIFAVALLTVAGYAMGQAVRAGHPDRYVVQEGDTLWDIAARFLTQPWLWPEIWQANPQIENPHRIYPGDVISLAYLNGEPRLQISRAAPSEARVREYPIPPIPLSTVEPFLRNLRVVEDIDGLPYVFAGEEGRIHSTAGQLIYVRGIEAPQKGDLYAVVRPTVRYTRVGGEKTVRGRASDLTWNGKKVRYGEWERVWKDVGDGGTEFLGIEVMTQARAQVVSSEGEVTALLLLDEGRDVREGDRLIAVQAKPWPLEFVPHRPAAIPAGARVLSVADAVNGGPQSVVALSVGSRDGAEVGQVYSIWREGEKEPDRVAHGINHTAAVWDRAKVPDGFAGHVMLFRTFDKVSYGLVMNGIRQVSTGNLLKQPDEF